MAAGSPSRRQKQAAATRQEILTAARRLFAERGYAATSMAAIAEAAETAVQTIYDSVGPKPAIVLALVDMAEGQAGVGAFIERMRAAEDPREMLRLHVGLCRQFVEHTSDVIATLMSAAPTVPDVAAAWAKANANHRRGAGMVVGRIAERGALVPDLTPERATDILAGLTWGTMWIQFVQTYGWSFDECADWMSESAVRLLLADGSSRVPE